MASGSSRKGDTIPERSRAHRELEEALVDLETLAKTGDCVAALSTDGVNASLLLLVVHGLRAYVTGDREQAVDDLRTAAEEIEARGELTSGEPC